MTLLGAAIRDIHIIDDLARGGGWLQNQAAAAKLIAAVLFSAAAMLQNRYALSAVLIFDAAALLLVAAFRLPWGILRRRLQCVGMMTLLLGAANPFFDKTSISVLGGLTLSGGFVSLLVLLGKAIAAVTATFILAAGTPLPEIGCALRRLGLPAALVSTLLLTYRYIVLLLIEADKMQTAIALRSPRRAIGWRGWASLLGLLLLRSLDRAERVQAAMSLRGFDGEIF